MSLRHPVHDLSPKIWFLRWETWLVRMWRHSRKCDMTHSHPRFIFLKYLALALRETWLMHVWRDSRRCEVSHFYTRFIPHRLCSCLERHAFTYEQVMSLYHVQRHDSWTSHVQRHDSWTSHVSVSCSYVKCEQVMFICVHFEQVMFICVHFDLFISSQTLLLLRETWLVHKILIVCLCTETCLYIYEQVMFICEVT